MQPFYVTYQHDRGQTPLRGVDNGAVQDLEGLGSGLDTSGAWAGGGPFVWIRNATNHRLVGWVRALPRHQVGRSGTWEAWGVQTAMETDCSGFPWNWRLLQEGPNSLDSFSAALASPKRRRITDDIPISKLVAILSNFYSRGRRSDPMTIPIDDPEDLPLLPWIWLLGPVQPQSATLSPPRKNLPAMSPPLTYVTLIDADFDFRQATSPYLQAAVQELITGSADEALRKIQTLRQTPPGKQARLLYTEDAARIVPSARQAPEHEGWSPPPLRRPSPAEADVQPQSSGPSWWRRLWPSGEIRVRNAGAIALMALVSATFVLEVMNYLALHPRQRNDESTIAGTQPAETQTVPTSTHAAVVTATAAPTPPIGNQPDLTRPGDRKDLWPSIREAVANAAKKDPASKKFGAEVEKYDPEHKPGDRFRLRNAVAQLYLKSRGCLRVPIGESVGPKFAEALDCAGDDRTLSTLLTSDEELARWLLAHS